MALIVNHMCKLTLSHACLSYCAHSCISVLTGLDLSVIYLSLLCFYSHMCRDLFCHVGESLEVISQDEDEDVQILSDC